MKDKNSQYHIIPIFIPHKGCPHDCIFCNQKRISGNIVPPSLNEIENIIKIHYTTKGENIPEIAFYGGSFTGLPIDEQEVYLSIAAKHKLKIRLSTRPDFINYEIIKLLQKYEVRLVELGVQSMEDEVLQCSNRGHSASDVINAVLLLKEANINFGIQTMIGLPKDNRELALKTAEKVIRLNPKTVRIYPTIVIKNTALSEMYARGEYKPLHLDEAVEITATLIEMYEESGINVIRVGLQATDNIRMSNENGDVEAGPYHPAFRQLVQTKRIYHKIMNQYMMNQQDLSNEDMEICFDNEKRIVSIKSDKFSMSDVIGQKRNNVLRIKSEIGYDIVYVM